MIQFHSWPALCVLWHKKEVTTILEFGLWKVTVGKLVYAHPGTSDNCRARCGAGASVPNVVFFFDDIANGAAGTANESNTKYREGSKE